MSKKEEMMRETSEIQNLKFHHPITKYFRKSKQKMEAKQKIEIISQHL